MKIYFHTPSFSFSFHAHREGRKIDVDPAFPPEIRGVSDADLASTSAESTPARRPCVHQFKKVG